MGAWPPGVLEACGPCLSQRGNVLVPGITGAGKTTLLQALARLLPSNEPVLVLDDCEELGWDGPLREFAPLRCGDSPNRLACNLTVALSQSASDSSLKPVVKDIQGVNKRCFALGSCRCSSCARPRGHELLRCK